MLVGIVVAVIVSVRPEGVPEFEPSLATPAEAGPRFVESTITVDARQADSWVRVDLSRGAVVDGRDGDWDVAFRRFRIRTNGLSGDPFPAGAIALEGMSFDRVTVAPRSGYETSRSGVRGDTLNEALEGWYRYRFWSHVLVPRPRTWVIRTAEGSYAKMAILSYYCTGASAGCVTFRYAYQGDGSRRLTRRTPGAGGGSAR